MSQLSDVHQALPGAIAVQAQVQNQSLVQGSAAAGQNVQHAKAAEEEVAYAEETQNPRVRAEGGRSQPGRRVGYCGTGGVAVAGREVERRLVRAWKARET